MKKIWKFSLEITDLQKARMPKGAVILTIKSQRGFPCLWAIVNPLETDYEDRHIEFIGTGNPFEEARRNYIGTIQTHNESLVWHVFERKDENK